MNIKSKQKEGVAGVKKRSEKATAAGKSNLAKWKAENPSGGALKHGAHSKHFRKRYLDKRTREGKRLNGVINDLICDLGGDENISTAQRLLIDNIRSKLIVLFQISKYIDLQPSIVNQKTGELLPCLARNFTTYSEALRRDLEALAKLATAVKMPSLAEYIDGKYGDGKK